MRVLVLTYAEPNQAALVHKLGNVADVVGVVVSSNVALSRRRRSRVARAAVGRTAGRPFRRAWQSLHERYASEYGGFPAVPQIQVSDVNDEAVPVLIEETRPDLVAVSGTNIVRAPVIEAARRHGAIVNLHTGLSPYVKGGPNCTNWCLARGWFDLIGNTVMWLDTGVDSGNLIATERTELNGAESLHELHWKVMEHAHDLYVRSVAALVAGRAVPNVRQADIGSGPTFTNADWSAVEMLRARWNFARLYQSDTRRAVRPDIRLVSLESED